MLLSCLCTYVHKMLVSWYTKKVNYVICSPTMVGIDYLFNRFNNKCIRLKGVCQNIKSFLLCQWLAPQSLGFLRDIDSE